jgi:hypothetical protein
MFDTPLSDTMDNSKEMPNFACKAGNGYAISTEVASSGK